MHVRAVFLSQVHNAFTDSSAGTEHRYHLVFQGVSGECMVRGDCLYLENLVCQKQVFGVGYLDVGFLARNDMHVPQSVAQDQSAVVGDFDIRIVHGALMRFTNCLCLKTLRRLTSSQCGSTGDVHDAVILCLNYGVHSGDGDIHGHMVFEAFVTVGNDLVVQERPDCVVEQYERVVLFHCKDTGGRTFPAGSPSVENLGDLDVAVSQQDFLKVGSVFAVDDDEYFINVGVAVDHVQRVFDDSPSGNLEKLLGGREFHAVA